MKNKISVKFLAAILSIMIMLSSVGYANAIQTSEPIDVGRTCSLRLTYHSGEKLFEGLDIQAFHIADVSASTQYSLTHQFESYPVNINAITSQTEWDAVASTLTSYIVSDSLTPTQQKTTNSEGVVKFEDLSTGLYLVRWTKNQTSDNVSGFEPFMMSVPNLDDYGNWFYDIDAYPKPGEYEPTGEEIEYRAIVLWNDIGFENHRPNSVQVEVFKDDVSYGIYTISAEDNWTCTWTAVDDGSTWTVVEHGVGAEYDITVSRYGNVFTIINYYNDKPEETYPSTENTEPSTGESVAPTTETTVPTDATELTEPTGTTEAAEPTGTEASEPTESTVPTETTATEPTEDSSTTPISTEPSESYTEPTEPETTELPSEDVTQPSNQDNTEAETTIPRIIGTPDESDATSKIFPNPGGSSTNPNKITYSSNNNAPLQTGDNRNVYIALLIAFAGLLIIIFGVTRRRRDDE